MFAHNFIRNSLLTTWLRYIKRLGYKRPLWISPLEVIKDRLKIEGNMITYKELLESEADKKKLKALDNMPMKTDWRTAEIPSIEKWIFKLFTFIDMDYLTKYLRNQDINMYKIEQRKFKTYLEKHKNMTGLIKKLEIIEI